MEDVSTCVAFFNMSSFLHRLDQCLELLIRTNRLPEAAFLARTYLPSQVSRVVKLWRENLAKINQKVSYIISIIALIRICVKVKLK